MNRYISPYPERKLAAPARGQRGTGSGAPVKRGDTGERTASWPVAGKPWATSYNRKTKFDVVHTHPATQGLS